ncbi:MAG: hypothetical protein WAO98_03470 [Alphaproteobacteria bacterium]
MYRLNQEILFQIGRQKITGKLIGIDHYSLESFANTRCKWPSYTLISDTKDVFSRFWFVRWTANEWILWTTTNAKEPPTKGMILSKSGVAKIKFTGDSGVSTPMASLVQFRNGSSYFCIERFINSEVMFFSGQKIKKPKII